ncbi:hypothetical protein T492DRAFT_855636 [Pavlovales sp. CCMP2436]|nr:hypothetical protein T492DRAFT_855636 [Pavlovales sp. CCMP2436]
MVNLLPDSREPVEAVTASVRAQLHREDIVCVATILVTAAYDGELIVWELDAFKGTSQPPIP